MPYVMDSGAYSPVGDYETVPGMDVVGGLAGWPAYQPSGTGWSQRQYETARQRSGGGVLHGLPDFFGAIRDDIKSAVRGAPAPTIIGKDGKVLGVAKKPTSTKPGVLKPASGKMTVQDPSGRVWTCTVVGGSVTTVAPAPAGTRPTVFPARPVPPPQGGPPRPVIIPAQPSGPPSPVIVGAQGGPPAPVIVGSRVTGPAPIGTTVIGTTVMGRRPAPPRPVVVPAQPPRPVVVGSSACPPCGTAAPATPFGPNLPARGIFGGRLPTATQFAGRPIGTSASTSVTAVPIAPTLHTPTGPWANIVRRPTGVTPMIKPRRLSPAFMVGTQAG